MKIVIPMAGLGSRFSELANEHPEYRVPKPLIQIKGMPMVKWATASYSSFLQQHVDDDKPVKLSDLIFICLGEHERKFHIGQKLREFYSPDITVLFVEKLTRGAAETAYLAKEYINTDEDVIISDSDHHFDGAPLWEAINTKRPKTIGILPVITPQDQKPTWSYVVLDDKGYVIEVREKDAELAQRRAPGILGGYYFSHGKDFIDEAEQMIQNNHRTGEKDKLEFYVSLVYTRLLAKQAQIEVAVIQEGWALGTPNQLQYFIQNYRGPVPNAYESSR